MAPKKTSITIQILQSTNIGATVGEQKQVTRVTLISIERETGSIKQFLAAAFQASLQESEFGPISYKNVT